MWRKERHWDMNFSEYLDFGGLSGIGSGVYQSTPCFGGLSGIRSGVYQSTSCFGGPSGIVSDVYQSTSYFGGLAL